MKKFIFAERNGILSSTCRNHRLHQRSLRSVRKTVLTGKSVLFIGTKKQAQVALLRNRALRHVFRQHRWLGGMLTNFTTIKRACNASRNWKRWKLTATFESLTRKNRLIKKERTKLERTWAH